jgi:Zn-dependent M16 (insulinase) family peptidase
LTILKKRIGDITEDNLEAICEITDSKRMQRIIDELKARLENSVRRGKALVPYSFQVGLTQVF